MTGSTTYLKNAILNQWLRDVSPTIPATGYVALFTTPPTGGAGGTEVSGGSYARASIPLDAASWAIAANGKTTNAVAIPYPAPTADWGTVVAWGLADATTAGNFLYVGLLRQPWFIQSASTVEFDIGALEINE